MTMRLNVCWPALVLALGLVSPSAALEPIVFDFERPDSPLNEVWTKYDPDSPTQNVRISDEKAKGGDRSLKVYGRVPEDFGVTYHPWRDWTGYAKLSFDLWIPSNVRQEEDAFDCWVYLKDSSYYWFETPIYADPVTLKRKVEPARGAWAHFELDISPESTIWRPGGHKRSWDYALRNPREFGIRFFGKEPWQGAVYIDNITLSGEALPLGKRGDSSARPRPHAAGWLQPTPNALSVPVYEKFELTFELDQQYSNPFDPEVVDIQGHFVSPSGKHIKLPGFYYQDHERSLTEEGFEKLIPVGAPCWKVRFAPKETGTHNYWVTVDDAAGHLESQAATFRATAPLKPQGYVRVSRNDPLYFEFENGDWFYPIGINMRDGGDDAAKQKGTYDFDHFFKRFHEEGINFVRTWMCAWWGGIEWSDEYHSRFHDAGRYNMYNAWRLDYCVDLARLYDIFLEITLNSHGQVRRDKYDEEWTYSPWNVRNGGHVASPAMFFSSDRVKNEFRNRYRYILARWGYSRNVMAWDLWNEVDLVEGYDTSLVPAWHREMAAYLRSIDPWKHIVVTHICLFFMDFGDEMWQLPEIEFIQSDAYWDQNHKKHGDFRIDMGMYASYLGKVNVKADYEPRFNKPFLFIEYGPQTASLPRPAPEWRQRFRIGLWTSAVLPNAAPAVFWYHKEWEEYKLFRYQKAVQKLFAEYDRRGKDFRMRTSDHKARTIFLTNAGTLKAIGMINDSEGFFYIHDPKNFGPEDRAEIEKRTQGAQMATYRVNPGMYDIEFIDTLTGDVTGKTEAEVPERPNMLRFDLPPIADDLLIRITRR